jgi:hypothetical protein
MAGQPAAQSRSRPCADAFTFIVHWGVVGAVTLSLLTGLRIAADYNASAAGTISAKLRWLLLEGPVIEWHIWSGWTLTFIAVSYAAFLWRARQVNRIKLDRSVWLRLRRARQRGGFWSDVPAWFAANVLIYQIGFVLIGLMALTGWLLYAEFRFGLGYHAIATVHGIIAYGFLLYVVVHVFAQLKAGNFWKVFRPRLDHGLAAGLAVIVSGTAVVAAFLVDRNEFVDLPIAKVADPPALDGDPGDPAWDASQVAKIHTARGANFPNGEVTVTVRAVHDGERVYFQFSWRDAERSQKHLPLVKEATGWRVLQSKFDINDEDDFYEDKFAMVLSRSPALASGTVHLGQKLVSGPHQPITRGLHFTEDGSVVDMWHWKSVRTGGMQPAHMDDNYFGPLMASDKPDVRYTGGYTQDPANGGGYILNWTKLAPDKPLGETLVIPRFLPAETALLERIGKADLDPAAGDEGTWHFQRGEVVGYDPKLDDYPVGTVLPGVVIEGPFHGDRGDLLAGAEWRDGYWTLEVTRALDTGSEFDVPLAEDRHTYLWVAVFNHTQTRHSQHLHPIRLLLE